MRANTPTSFLLDEATGWQTSHGDRVVADSRIGLHLGADASGPLALSSPDGSLGGLVLPVGMALDSDGLLYLFAERDGSRVRRFDPIVRRFEALNEDWRAVPQREQLVSDATFEVPDSDAPPTTDSGSTIESVIAGDFGAADASVGIPNPPFDPPLLEQPVSLAVVGHHLYLAAPQSHSLQVFYLASNCMSLAFLWGLDPRSASSSDFGFELFQPADVVSHDGSAYILDRTFGRVFRHRPGDNKPHLVLDEPEAKGRWTRLALDRAGRLYLLDPSVPRLEIYELDEAGCEPIGCGSADGRPLGHRPLTARRVGQVLESGEVRSRFAAPAIRLDHRERFCLPAGLARLCDRCVSSPPVDEPLAGCTDGGLLFDRQGEPVEAPDPAEPGGLPLYASEGAWFSEALDSQIHRCQWHRIELDLGDLPPGSQVLVSTYTAPENRVAEKPQDLPDHLWQTRFQITGPMQPPEAAPAHRARHEELLIQSGEGRYL